MSEHESKVTQIIFKPVGEPIFSERATTIMIDDEAGGEYVTVEQHGNGLGKIVINPEEWPGLRAVIEQMIAGCEF